MTRKPRFGAPIFSITGKTRRALSARLEVVPDALYRHVRSKEQLQNLVVDSVTYLPDLARAP
jgi:hypothetical protein